MKIATWNVNSVNARLPTMLEVFKAVPADVWCLQELKCIDEKFPREDIEALCNSLYKIPKTIEKFAESAEEFRKKSANPPELKKRIA